MLDGRLKMMSIGRRREDCGVTLRVDSEEF